MPSATLTRRKNWTDRELESLPQNGQKYELLINWKLEQIHVYGPDSIEALTRPADILSGAEVLPGFKCRL